MGIALVGDVGRDQVRFAQVDLGSTAPPYNIKTMPAASYLTFTDAILSYVKMVGHTGSIQALALAVAGVPRGDSFGATNGRWRLSISGLATYFGVKPNILNDFAASAYALKSLPQTAFRAIGSNGASKPAKEASFVLIGPLDGLGVAAVISQGGGDYVIQSEAGHSSLAPVNADAQAFLGSLNKTQRVTYAEHLLSESGLRRCYSFFSSNGSAEISPISVSKIISQTHTDPFAKASVDLFALQMAAFSRDMVTSFGAWDGVYFCGDLAKTLSDRLSDQIFRAQFAENHSYSRLLREVPIGLVVEPDLALLGLAALARQTV